eukprot:3460366-Amphidinium_carterae.1
MRSSLLETKDATVTMNRVTVWQEFSAGNICAWSFILAPSMLYYFVALPYLWNEVLQMKSHRASCRFKAALDLTLTCLVIACKFEGSSCTMMSLDFPRWGKYSLPQL